MILTLALDTFIFAIIRLFNSDGKLFPQNAVILNFGKWLATKANRVITMVNVQVRGGKLGLRNQP